MSYLLDTDIIIYWLNDAIPNIRNKINSIANDEIYISSITVAELYFGAYYSSQVIKNIELLNEFTSELNILYLDTECGKIFGKIKADLKKEGKIINDSDLFIASIAINNKMRLVTNNDKHFKRIEDLQVENWI
ncbi:MAG: PIN domain-containing protein [Desulfobacula sp.]|jgi:tRNA(fMet)-specific endonuclease VapC|uniref:PIN domain-containing protein n=1 Tax=Desulfobacula sp. TaxID=2593537 RepID=UPI001DC6828A|nr:PIN domain-containing protein [Desulfobacula sp.]MBT4197903.1 PIN domain-containing protein [Desulfobacula sp.]MBT4507963.1 PIN domain-containing protein [Desulfobacula sp.]MBT4873852.1 PIN domain-containing protein [Desulfobacula sp.]MBT5544971.1 PIN domain-containing protein [Desulfobacula sp.]